MSFCAVAQRCLTGAMADFMLPNIGLAVGSQIMPPVSLRRATGQNDIAQPQFPKLTQQRCITGARIVAKIIN